MAVIRTERGYAGHLVVTGYCQYRRNTLLEYGDVRVVVSSIGNYRPSSPNGLAESISTGDIFYETMAFHAQMDGGYWEADIRRHVAFDSPSTLGEVTQQTDLLMDQQHEVVVNEITKLLTMGFITNESDAVEGGDE